MPNKKRTIKFSEAILDGMSYALKNIQGTYIIGEGVPDPKAIFGTTKGLSKKFRNKKIFDMPVAEAGMTGIVIGSSINGLRPILIHQRVDFMLISMDQLANTAAKLSYIFNGQLSVPIVIRAVIGRGWGQSAQHSQTLESLFANFPGLKVVSPSNAIDARDLLVASIYDNNPVIFLEHRWLHDTYSNYRPLKKMFLNGPKKISNGNDLTVIGFSYSISEILKAEKILKKIDINIEIIDLRVIRPLNLNLVYDSVLKTKKVIIVDNGFSEYGVSSEIIASICEKMSDKLSKNPIRIGIDSHPTPSSKSLIKNYYPSIKKILLSVTKILNLSDSKIKKLDEELLKTNNNNLEIDVPNQYFKGPF